MSLWLSEKDFTRESAEASGISLNVAFLQEIKTDFGFRELLNKVYYQFKPSDPAAHDEGLAPRVAAELLGDLRDELETYFALEEFYGYFAESAITNPPVSSKADELKQQHKSLFLSLSELVELAEQIVYQEASPEVTIELIGDDFEAFCKELAHHEQAEMELMMQLCNEDFGVGD